MRQNYVFHAFSSQKQIIQPMQTFLCASLLSKGWSEAQWLKLVTDLMIDCRKTRFLRFNSQHTAWFEDGGISVMKKTAVWGDMVF